jgi:hypothetical protein
MVVEVSTYIPRKTDKIIDKIGKINQAVYKRVIFDWPKCQVGRGARKYVGRIWSCDQAPPPIVSPPVFFLFSPPSPRRSFER